MKKKLAIVTTVFIACTITINAISNNKESSYQDDAIPIVRKQVDLLSYYLETYYGSGEYEMTSGETWPTDGYEFNSTLSKCENGSKLAWDDTNKVVTMTGNMSDKCYIYFDKVVKPKITSVEVDGEDDYVIGLYINYESEYQIVGAYLIQNNVEDNGKKYDSDVWLFYGYNCGCSDMQIYIVDENGSKSDNYSFHHTYTCFPAGTKIFTKNGYKNIEDIKVNDVVYSYNETTNKVELNKVTKTFIHQDFEIYNLYSDNKIIRVTPYHRFYVLRNNNYEWVAVKDLKLTDKLFDSNKELININKIEFMKENNTVYNFEVANNHTYFVSENNILVHNAKGPCF